MSTINGIGNGLSGTTGTGNFVGATSPTLITPILGVSTATSINFGGSALSNYISAGSWTPVDASGASLTFTSVSASYTRIGNMVFAYCSLTYPATADATVAKIGGFPIAPANTAYGQQGSISYTNVTAATYAILAQGQTNASIYGSNGAALTNVALTTGLLYLMFIYPAA